MRVTVATRPQCHRFSDQGDICIWLDASARVEIRDPGHGMTPEEISALYARIARGRDRGSGIGLGHRPPQQTLAAAGRRGRMVARACG